MVLSASDLINNLECEHLTWVDLERSLGRLDADPKRPDTAALVAQKGDEHERRYLAERRAELGDQLVEIETGDGARGLIAAAERTADSMRDGAPLIFQATFFYDGWRGHADFVERVDRSSELGEFSYEVI